jgi:short-subunit dehydrogenase
VSVLCPGFTRTEFQERAGAEGERLPGFVWQNAEQVAKAGLDGLERNKAVIVPGAINRITAGFVSVTPGVVSRRTAAALARFYG